MDHIGIAHPFSPRLEIGPVIDYRRGRAERNAVARRRHPGTARLVEIMAGRRVAHGLIGLGGLLDLAGEIDLVLKVGGRDFRAILLGAKKPNIVRHASRATTSEPTTLNTLPCSVCYLNN